MSLEPLLISQSPIPTHALAAILAILLGGYQLYARKGTRFHKACGYVWVLLMAYVAVSSFFIHELRLIGPCSPIHLLSIFVLWSLAEAIWMVRKGQIQKHKRIMQRLYVLGLIITGLFTFFPGRTMFKVLFGG